MTIDLNARREAFYKGLIAPPTTTNTQFGFTGYNLVFSNLFKDIVNETVIENPDLALDLIDILKNAPIESLPEESKSEFYKQAIHRISIQYLDPIIFNPRDKESKAIHERVLDYLLEMNSSESIEFLRKKIPSLYQSYVRSHESPDAITERAKKWISARINHQPEEGQNNNLDWDVSKFLTAMATPVNRLKSEIDKELMSHAIDTLIASGLSYSASSVVRQSYGQQQLADETAENQWKTYIIERIIETHPQPNESDILTIRMLGGIDDNIESLIVQYLETYLNCHPDGTHIDDSIRLLSCFGSAAIAALGRLGNPLAVNSLRSADKKHTPEILEALSSIRSRREEGNTADVDAAILHVVSPLLSAEIIFKSIRAGNEDSLRASFAHGVNAGVLSNAAVTKLIENALVVVRSQDSIERIIAEMKQLPVPKGAGGS